MNDNNNKKNEFKSPAETWSVGIKVTQCSRRPAYYESRVGCSFFFFFFSTTKCVKWPSGVRSHTHSYSRTFQVDSRRDATHSARTLCKILNHILIYFHFLGQRRCVGAIGTLASACVCVSSVIIAAARADSARESPLAI